MSTVSRLSVGSNNKIRRRRVTTACLHCRSRRVKCDRMRPSCSQCNKAFRNCKYADDELFKVKFVNKAEDAQEDMPEDTPSNSSSGTWKSAIDHQADFVKKLAKTKDGVSLWPAAEAQEPELPTTTSGSQDSLVHAIPISALGDRFILTLNSNLPPRGICQSFFHTFLQHIQPIIPVCHSPTLEREYSEFVDALSPASSAKTLALVLAVLYTGAVASGSCDKFHSIAILEIYEELLRLVDFSSYHVGNVAASTHFLQAYVIMNTFRASQLAPFFAYGFLPQAIRFAQSLRLHVGQKKGNPIDIEVRRRLWWHLVFIDIESTIATGLPPIIHRSGYTTQLPSLLEDRAILQSSDNKIPPQSGSFSPVMVAMQAHYIWAQRMQAWFESLPSHGEVTQFKTLLETLLDLIPDNSEPDSQWARTYLKMQIDRGYCMLGLRFWQPDQYKGTGCHSEVVKTARSFLTHYRTLSTLKIPRNFTWFVPGLVQPLHALVIILKHISTCTNLREEETLSRTLIDDILHLRVEHILSGDLVPKTMRNVGENRPSRANPRYLIMVSLRRRVWKIVGWEDDGKGKDPWGGRFIEAFAETAAEKLPCEGFELVPEQKVDVPEQAWNGEWPEEVGTGMEELDTLLSGDPLDMFQWDEWESLTSDFFAS